MEKEQDSESATSDLTNSEPAKSAKTHTCWLKRQLRSTLFSIHSLLPNYIPSPYPRDTAYIEKRDREQNLQTAIGQDENLELGCIWVAEFYGPNEIDGLYGGLQSLGWHIDRYRLGSDPLSWIRHQRMYGNGGSFQLNRIVRKASARGAGGVNRVADFPKSFDSLIGTIYQATPSLTCLLMCFQLSDDKSSSLTNAINADYKTSYKRLKGLRGYNIMSARHKKEAALVALKEEFRGEAVSWMEQNFPGYFQTKSDPKRFPTGELLVTKSYPAFSVENVKAFGANHWGNLVGLDRYFDSWVGSKHTALAFRFDERLYKMRNHTTVALNSDRLTEGDLMFTGGDTLGSKVAYAYECIEGVLCNYFIIGYLSEVRRSLSEIRERIKAQDKTPDAGLTTLTDLEKFFANSIGTPAIARELAEYARKEGWLHINCSGFTNQRHSEKAVEQLDISTGISQSILQMAEKTILEDGETRTYLEQYSSILGTREAIKTQRIGQVLSLIAVIIALAALFTS